MTYTVPEPLLDKSRRFQKLYLSAIGAALISIVMLQSGCEKSKYIEGKSPFINLSCQYNNFYTLKQNSPSVARNNNLKLVVNDIDASAGAFTMTMWDDDTNYIFQGFPGKRTVFFSGIKRIRPSESDMKAVRSIIEGLRLSCKESR